MEGELVVFSHDCHCAIRDGRFGSSPAFVHAGNVGIILSEYLKDPVIGQTAYEVLIGDQIYFEIDGDVIFLHK